MERMDRQFIIDEIINIGVNEIKSSKELMSSIVIEIAPEILCWEITGFDTITPKLAELESSEHPLKEALQSVINNEGETLSEAITRMIRTSVDEL